MHWQLSSTNLWSEFGLRTVERVSINLFWSLGREKITHSLTLNTGLVFQMNPVVSFTLGLMSCAITQALVVTAIALEFFGAMMGSF